MKKIICIAALTAAAVSCSKNIPSFQAPASNPEIQSQVQEGSINIKFDTPATKADLSQDEAKINDVYVCIFNNDSKTLDVEPVKVTSYDSSKGIVIQNVAYGSKSVAVAINCGDNTPSSESFEKFMDSTSDLKTNTRTNLVMVGYNDNFNVSAQENTVKIQVKRLVAKIIVGDVKYDFSSNNIVVPTIKLNGVYIGNCGSVVDMDGEYVEGIYNSYKPSEAIKLDSAVSGICACDLNISVSSSYQTIGKTLYSYANPSEQEASRPYLVIGCTYNSVQRYYRYPLPKIQANKVYDIKHVILSHAPDSGNITVEINLGNWDDPSEPWINNGTIEL